MGSTSLIFSSKFLVGSERKKGIDGALHIYICKTPFLMITQNKYQNFVGGPFEGAVAIRVQIGFVNINRGKK